jgi:predicted RNA binding protein YcfA (HicA-like mRNA interferase family)
MPKLPSFTPKEIEKVLLKNGFLIKRQTGGHRIFYCQGSERVTVVPFHSKDIAKGTVRSIIKQSGLNEDCFKKK